MGREFMKPSHDEIVAPRRMPMPATKKSAVVAEPEPKVECENLLFDRDLHLSAQALSILAFLAGGEWGLYVERFSVNMLTYAWYNCRERGVAVVVKQPLRMISGKRLVLIFGEHRSSDGIFLDKWEDDSSEFKPPTLEDFTEETYEKRRYFKYGAVGTVAHAIVDDIKKFLDIE